MATLPSISFAKFSPPTGGVAVVLAAEGLVLGDHAKACDPGSALPRAFAAIDFKAKFGSTTELLAPSGSPLDRIAVVGLGKAADLSTYAWLRVGGVIATQLRKGRDVTLIADVPDTEVEMSRIAEMASGILLRSYSFDKYRTRKNDDEDKPAKPVKVTIQCANPAAARKAFGDAKAVADGVMLARDLVNEPANTLGPVELAEKARELAPLGLKVEILTEKEMKKLGMGALLGVAQGSSRPARLAVMTWSGGKPKDKPVVFVGKGVVFDTGGNSMKTASGMEDMKGDMGGSAAVIGAMHALAARKAKANVIGIAGVVENMVDGNAQRPGDIVTSMSGQTIEVLNTDAEGRLVLADALWYAAERFKPAVMIDLATLTGAIMIALGQNHAGLFSNDDTLSDQLVAAGKETHERLWRLPMGDDYDKLIDSKNADMKNIGGRFGGAISAAQFLKRFVKDVPWAHLDIAGTAMSTPSIEYNNSWGTGFGVRLLNQFVRDNYEA